MLNTTASRPCDRPHTNPPTSTPRPWKTVTASICDSCSWNSKQLDYCSTVRSVRFIIWALMAEGCQKNCIFRWCFLTGIIWLSIYMSVCLLLLQICFLDIQFCKLKKYFKENLNSGVVAEISVVEILWSCMQKCKKKTLFMFNTAKTVKWFRNMSD